MTEPKRIEDALVGYTGPKDAVFSLRSRIDADCEFCGTKPHNPCQHTPNEAFDHPAPAPAEHTAADASNREAGGVVHGDILTSAAGVSDVAEMAKDLIEYANREGVYWIAEGGLMLQQQAERITTLTAELARVKAERDAALKDAERHVALLKRCIATCEIVPAKVRNGEHIALPDQIRKAIAAREG